MRGEGREVGIGSKRKVPSFRYAFAGSRSEVSFPGGTLHTSYGR